MTFGEHLIEDGANHTKNDWSKIAFCKTPEMIKSEIVFGDLKKCKTKCTNKEWCKSFDFCSKDPKNTFCHLKNTSRWDLQKLPADFKNVKSKLHHMQNLTGFSDYYEVL